MIRDRDIEISEAIISIFREMFESGELKATDEDIIGFLTNEGYDSFVIKEVLLWLEEALESPLSEIKPDKGKLYLRVISYLNRLKIDTEAYDIIHKLSSTGLLIGDKLEGVLKLIMLENDKEYISEERLWRIIQKISGSKDAELYKEYISDSSKKLFH